MKIVFWGTGSGGKILLSFCKKFSILPDFFVSNDSSLWYSYIDSVLVLPPESLKNYSISEIYIACSAAEEVKQVISKMQLSCEVIEATFPYTPSFLKKFSSQIDLYFSNLTKVYSVNLIRKKGCYIDLSDGPNYSGITDWSIQFHYLLKEKEISSQFMIRNFYVYHSHNINPIFKNSKEASFLDETVDISIPYRKIIEGDYDTIVCNFVQNFFVAACYAKKILNEKIKNVLIIHNLHQIYFSSAVYFSEYIDECYYISDYIREKLIVVGFPKEKLKKLQWFLPYYSILPRRKVVSSTIRIGYAGRIVIEQKRLDLLVEVADELAKRNIDFVITIAGERNNDFEYLMSIIRNKLLERYFNFIGYIAKEKILQFWQKQDIFLSCSEYEGHSITQIEAIYAGVVPVVTDVSGVSDDIVDGYNGFISPISDIIGLANNIQKLYEDRNLLKTMSDRCIESSIKFRKNIVAQDYFNIVKN